MSQWLSEYWWAITAGGLGIGGGILKWFFTRRKKPTVRTQDAIKRAEEELDAKHEAVVKENSDGRAADHAARLEWLSKGGPDRKTPD